MRKVDDVVADNIARRMKANPLCDTQTKLAKRAGISQSHVSRLLNKAASATIGTLSKVAEALGCAPYELLLDDDNARRALIERLMSGPAAPTERVERAGFIPLDKTGAPKKKA